jgi:hypothetical protein
MFPDTVIRLTKLCNVDEERPLIIRLHEGRRVLGSYTTRLGQLLEMTGNESNLIDPNTNASMGTIICVCQSDEEIAVPTFPKVCSLLSVVVFSWFIILPAFFFLLIFFFLVFLLSSLVTKRWFRTSFHCWH